MSWQSDMHLNMMHATDSMIDEYLQEQFMEYTTKVKDHECNLTEAEHSVVKYIYSGPFVEFRRWFRLQLLADPNHPSSKGKLKSTAKIKADQDNHLQHHYYMVHPFSRARYTWQCFLVLVYFVDFVFMPFDISLKYTPDFIWIGQFVCDIFLTIDHIAEFFTGYFDEKHQKVVLSAKMVARRYLRTYFIFDVLSSIPVNCVLMTTQMNDEPYTYWKIVSAFRLSRITTVSSYVEEICTRRKTSSTLLLKVTRLTLILTIVIFWAVGVRAYIRTGFPFAISRKTRTERIQFSMRDVCSKFMLVGLGHEYDGHSIVLWMKDIIFLSVGAFLTKYMLLQVLNIYNRINGGHDFYEKTMREIDQYVLYKSIPSNLKTKIDHYLDFQYQKQFYKESSIFSIVSSKLMQDILSHKCQRLVENVELFKDLPASAVLKIVTKLRSETYLPDDIIVRAGKVGNSMFFISEGMVAVYTEDGEEVTHLYNSDNFGEIALLIRAPRTATIVAVQECELYRLSRKDFQEVLTQYPNILRKLENEVHERIKQIGMISHGGQGESPTDVRDSIIPN